MEENRTLLRRSARRLVVVIYLLVIGIAIAAYFLINDLEQSGIVRDTQTERAWATLGLMGLWSAICYRLYRINTRLFDQRSQVIDARETELFATREAARLREQFMANMSHEIRTPLNSIIGFGKLLSRADLGPPERELSRNIQIASETLLNIVNDILDFSKIEAGMLVLEQVPFDPNELLLSVQRMFVEKAQQKNLSLDLHVAPGLPEQLIGDPTRLTQILVNLIGNALKFTERGGVVVSAYPLPAASSGQISLRFEVRDSGIGIPAVQIDRIFDRFTQTNEQTTRIYGGTGLGLAIVRQLVIAMQGNVSVQSEPGLGSVFTVVLPFKPAQDKLVQAPTTRGEFKGSPALASVRVLVAEDNPMNQRMLELLFAEWKVDHTMTRNGREALEMLSENSPEVFDLVLMDIQMPELDGYETTRRIREQLKLPVPIVAMTAHAHQGEREKCLQYGMDDYITKPIREQELRRVLVHYALKSTSSATPLMDIDYFEQTTMGNPGNQRELAGIFLSQVPADLEAITTALEASDYDAAARAAHNMKSTVGYIGFSRNIGQQLTAFETACSTSRDPQFLQHKLEEIKNQVMQATREVKKILSVQN